MECLTGSQKTAEPIRGFAEHRGRRPVFASGLGPGAAERSGPVTEFELIRRFFDRGPLRRTELGIGDDAAVLDLRGEHLVTCTDMLIEGRHFFVGTDPAAIGHKSLAVNLSDLAAMGAQPIAFALALALPSVDESWLSAFANGLFSAADAAGCELLGGDTTRGPLNICITAYGSVSAGAAIRRDRAEPGEDIWVSGALGAASAAVRLRSSLAGPDRFTGLPAALARRLDWPEPRLALGLALRHVASAAIDISDGLIADLSHIAERSRTGMHLTADDIPVDPALSSLFSTPDALRLALNGGDDYELAWTAPAENRVAIDGIAARLGLSATRIGSVHAGEGIKVTDRGGKPIIQIPDGHDHFA